MTCGVSRCFEGYFPQLSITCTAIFPRLGEITPITPHNTASIEFRGSAEAETHTIAHAVRHWPTNRTTHPPAIVRTPIAAPPMHPFREMKKPFDHSSLRLVLGSTTPAVPSRADHASTAPRPPRLVTRDDQRTDRSWHPSRGNFRQRVGRVSLLDRSVAETPPLSKRHIREKSFTPPPLKGPKNAD